MSKIITLSTTAFLALSTLAPSAWAIGRGSGTMDVDDAAETLPDNVLTVDADAAGGDGSSWADAYHDLQEAIEDAALVATAENPIQIWVKAGNYTPTEYVPPFAFCLGKLNQSSVEEEHCDRNGDGYILLDDIAALLQSPETDRSISFELRDNVAIYGGFAGGESSLGARDVAANETILSGDLQDNDDPNDAGSNDENSYHVVYSKDLSSSALLDGFTITGGNAHGPGGATHWGGGMYNDGSSPTLSNLIFSGNTAHRCGGGMYNYRFSKPSLTNVAFTKNTANMGGGMYNEHSRPTLTKVTFSANKALWSGFGGGMYNDESSVTLTNVTFSRNTAYHGGGVYNFVSNPTFNNVTFIRNEARHGGGAYNIASSPSLTNVTFSGNSANLGSGGAMYNSTFSAPPIANAIFWGNTATTSGDEIYNDPSASYPSNPSISYTASETGFTGSGNITLTASPFAAEPSAGDDGIWDSEDDVLPVLAEDSVCIDAGNDSLVTASTDLNENPRIVDGDGDGYAIVDMGAYEKQ